MYQKIWLLSLACMIGECTYASQVKPVESATDQQESLAADDQSVVSTQESEESTNNDAADRAYHKALYHVDSGNEMGTVDLMKSASKQGSAAAAYWLGCHYAVKKDIKARNSYWLLAAERKHPEALYKIGSLYYKGRPPFKEADEKGAFAYFKQSADLGCKKAIEALCSMAVVSKYKPADDYVQRNVEKNSYIHYCLGKLSYEKDEVNEAYKHFVAAVEGGSREAWDFIVTNAHRSGNVCAQYAAGILQYKGVPPVVQKDKKMAFVYLKNAAQNGYKLAVDKLFALARQDEALLMTIKHWVWELNTPELLHRLGLLCAEKDKVSASIYFFRAAVQGYAPSETMLKTMASKGDGVAKDYVNQLNSEKGGQVTRTSSAVGDCEAGLLFIQVASDFNDKNAQQAFRFFSLSAEQYYARAEYYLSLCYQYGFGVKQNLAKAAEYMKMAREGGCVLTVNGSTLFGEVLTRSAQKKEAAKKEEKQQAPIEAEDLLLQRAKAQ